MSADIMQSLQGVLGSIGGSANGVGAAATPGMQQALMAANPGMTPAMASGATVAGAMPNAPSSLTAGLSPQDALYAQMAKNLQTQSELAPLSGLADVGAAYIDKNVEARHQMPLAPAFGMAHSIMGPLQFGSSQSPLLTYLSMLGAR